MQEKKIFLKFYGYHGKIFWVFLCILLMVIIMCVYSVYIVMNDYLYVHIVMRDYLCLFMPKTVILYFYCMFKARKKTNNLRYIAYYIHYYITS